MLSKFKLDEVRWQTHERHLRIVREQVFIIEQQVPYALEWDEFDQSAQHLLVQSALNEPIACARLLESGYLGRMAVLKGWRGYGVGLALLKKAIEIFSENGIAIIKISAQIHAIEFYRKKGFLVTSQPYLDANIVHVDMQLLLKE